MTCFFIDPFVLLQSLLGVRWLCWFLLAGCCRRLVAWFITLSYIIFGAVVTVAPGRCGVPLSVFSLRLFLCLFLFSLDVSVLLVILGRFPWMAPLELMTVVLWLGFLPIYRCSVPSGFTYGSSVLFPLLGGRYTQVSWLMLFFHSCIFWLVDCCIAF